MIILGESPDRLLWEPIRGLSGCGLYFSLCKWIGDSAEEIRIFWYRHDQKVTRWFRTLPYKSLFDANLDMTDIGNQIHRVSHANDFIEKVSRRRRDHIQGLNERRLERRQVARDAQKLLRHPNYGRF